MSAKLFAESLMKYVLGVVLVGTLVFVPAGTLRFQNGWLFMAVLFVPMFLAGLVLLVKKPDLLKKRLDGKEKQREQGRLVKLSGLMFLVGFVVAGMDFRWGWTTLPMETSIAAAVVFLFGYGLYAMVLRENSFLSRTIEVQEGQRVVDTGLYGLVRHPMYTATLFLFLTMPLILGSVWAFVVFLLYPVLIVGRIRHEESFLEENLPGYREYRQKVRYRLIPFVW